MGKARRSGLKKKKDDRSSNNNSAERSKLSRKGNKKGRKGSGWSNQLEKELNAIGLRIQQVDADGSCLFRSLADQTQGSSGDHRQLRQSIVNHIKNNRSSFEPFIEDDEPFDDYIERMAEDGTWGGQLEIQAASELLRSNINIFQPEQPPWLIQNFPDSDVMLHISFHDGCHYNSVRLYDDYTDGPPLPIPFTSSMNTSSMNTKTANGDIRKENHRVIAMEEEETENYYVSTSAMMNDKNKDAIHKDADLSFEKNYTASYHHQGTVNGKYNEEKVRVELVVSKKGKGKKVKVVLHTSPPYIDDVSVPGKRKKEKKGALPARNARCQCGSTRKYKNCCGKTENCVEICKSDDDIVHAFDTVLYL